MKKKKCMREREGERNSVKFMTRLGDKEIRKWGWRVLVGEECRMGRNVFNIQLNESLERKLI